MMRINAIYILSFCVLVLQTQPAYAKIYHYSLLELVEKADYIVTGKVVEVGDTTAVVKLDQVIEGRITEKQITVTGIYAHHCLGKTKNFTKGDNVLLFLSAPKGGVYKVICGGQGKITLHDGVIKAYYFTSAKEYKVNDFIKSVKRLIEISEISDGDAKIRILFDLCESPDPVLRRSAWRYIRMKVYRSGKSTELRKNVIKMLSSKYPDTRIEGVNLLACFKDAEAAKLIVKAAWDPDYNVVANAILTLYRIDRPKAVEILVGLGKHKDHMVRTFACLELYRNGHPGHKEACRKLFASKDEKVLIAAAKMLTRAGVRGEAVKEVIYPKLVGMLDNSSEELLSAALFGLSACDEPEALRLLMPFLVKKETSGKTKAEVVRGIHHVLLRTKDEYFAGNPDLKKYLHENLHLVIEHLEGDGLNPKSAISILRIVGTPVAIEALKRAVKNHPDPTVRQFAEASLKEKREVNGGCASGSGAKIALLLPLLLLVFFAVFRKKIFKTR